MTLHHVLAADYQSRTVDEVTMTPAYQHVVFVASACLCRADVDILVREHMQQL